MNATITSCHQEAASNDQQMTQQNAGGKQTHHTVFTPRFDIWEGDNELILYCDLPGVDSTNLHIQFDNRQLTIDGKVCRQCNAREYLYSEYGVGDFHRTFTIGEAIDTDKISAELNDGVLTLRLPKIEDVKPRRIEVKTK